MCEAIEVFKRGKEDEKMNKYLKLLFYASLCVAVESSSTGVVFADEDNNLPSESTVLAAATAETGAETDENAAAPANRPITAEEGSTAEAAPLRAATSVTNPTTAEEGATTDTARSENMTETNAVQPDEHKSNIKFPPFRPVVNGMPVTYSSGTASIDHVVITAKPAADISGSTLTSCGIKSDVVSLAGGSKIISLVENTVEVKGQNLDEINKLPKVSYKDFKTEGAKDSFDIIAKNTPVNQGFMMPVTYEIKAKDVDGKEIAGATPITFTGYRLIRKISDDKFQIALYSPLNGNGLAPLKPLSPGYNLNMEREVYWLNSNGKVGFVGNSHGLGIDELKKIVVKEDQELAKKGIMVNGNGNRIIAGRAINGAGLFFFGNYSLKELENLDNPKFTVWLNGKTFDDKSNIEFKKPKNEVLKIEKNNNNVLDALKAHIKEVKTTDGGVASYADNFVSEPNEYIAHINNLIDPMGTTVSKANTGKYVIRVYDSNVQEVPLENLKNKLEVGKEYTAKVILRLAALNNPANAFAYDKEEAFKFSINTPEAKPDPRTPGEGDGGNVENPDPEPGQPGTTVDPEPGQPGTTVDPKPGQPGTAPQPGTTVTPNPGQPDARDNDISVNDNNLSENRPGYESSEKAEFISSGNPKKSAKAPDTSDQSQLPAYVFILTIAGFCTALAAKRKHSNLKEK